MDCNTGDECVERFIFHAPECSTIESDNLKRSLLKKIDIYTDEEREFCRPSPVKLRKANVITDSENYITASTEFGDYQETVKNISLNDPWAITFTEEGNKIITEQGGTVKAYNGTRTVKEGEIDAVKSGNGGLMGVALHPSYSENSQIYVYYTYDTFKSGDDEKLRNRLSRFEFESEGLRNEKIILDNVTGGLHHSGGRVEVSPDNYLYLTTGDAEVGKKALNKSTLEGKVIRLNLDGSVPEDNPFDNEVYSYGHRNPQGLALSPSGEIFATEHGDQQHDEINRIEKGENYGWPMTECDDPRNTENVEIDFQRPVVCFEEFTQAPSGATFVNSSGHPWHGDIFVTGLRGENLYRLYFDDENQVEEGAIFYINTDSTRESGLSRRLRDVTYHNGSLWALGDSKGLVELSSN